MPYEKTHTVFLLTRNMPHPKGHRRRTEEGSSYDKRMKISLASKICIEKNPLIRYKEGIDNI